MVRAAGTGAGVQVSRAGLRETVGAAILDGRGPRLVGGLLAIGLSVPSVRPLGGHGLGLVVLVLVVLNAGMLLGRMLPARLRAGVPQTPLFVLGVTTAAALMGLDRSGSSATFAFFLAGQIGYRVDTRAAAAWAATISGTCTVAVLVAHAASHLGTPWWLAALTGSTVLLGIANRNHELALAAAHEAARQTEAAAKSAALAEAMAERARIARDVHDVLAHSLAGINLQLEAVDALLDAGQPERARTATRQAQSLVREGLAEVSRTVQAMRADALPLVATLTSLVETAAPEGTALRVSGEEVDLPASITTALLRCAQESLTNARKYAPGAAVEVFLALGPDDVELMVRNGAPSHSARPLASSGSGLGLVGMRERIRGVGGNLHTGPMVDGQWAGGWQVLATVPQRSGAIRR